MLIVFIILAIILGSYIFHSQKQKNEGGNNAQNNTTTATSSYPNNKAEIDLAKEISTKSTNISPKPTKTINTSNTTDFPHTHPSSQGNIKVERVYPESSMGQSQSEGCEEHYYDRYVLIKDDIKEEGVMVELAKTMVIGEALNNPVFKKYRKQ